jgi:hypothetical protein
MGIAPEYVHILNLNYQPRANMTAWNNIHENFRPDCRDIFGDARDYQGCMKARGILATSLIVKEPWHETGNRFRPDTFPSPSQSSRRRTSIASSDHES